MTGVCRDEATDRSQLRRVLTACLLTGFAVLIDQNMIAVALPTIERDLRMTTPQATWAASGYVLAIALTLVVGGRLGDDYGRRRVLLVSMSFFVLAAAGCSLAPSGTWFVVSRACVGCAAGLVNPQIIGIMHHMFGGHDRGRAFGFYSATISFAGVFAPLLGGALISMSHAWQPAFYPSAIIGLVGLVWGRLLLPADPPGRAPARIDLIGIVLLGLSIVLIVLPVAEAGERDVHPIWWLAAAGPAFFAAFCWWEKDLELRDRVPLVRLRLLRVRSYWVGALTEAFFFAGYPGMLLLSQFYFQQGLHYSALLAGATTMTCGLASTLAAILGGRLVDRYGRRLVVGGCMTVIVGMSLSAVIMTTRVGGGTALTLIAPFVMCGIGAGLIMAPNQTLTLAEVPRTEGSTAAGVYQVGMRIGQSLGMSFALSLYSAGLARWHGDIPKATAIGISASGVLVILALVTRLGDILWSYRERREITTDEVPVRVSSVSDEPCP